MSEGVMAIKFTKLSRQNIRKTPIGLKIIEHGICFKRLKNGDGCYSVNIMVDGIRIHRVIGKESEGVTRKQAEEFIENARTDARYDRLNLPKGRKTSLGFKDASEKYIAKLTQEGGKDLKMKNYRFDMHLSPFFKNKPLSRITSFDVERYKKARKESGAALATVNRELAAMSHLYTKAVDWKWINYKPSIIKKFKENPTRIIYLTVEQARRLIEAAKEDQNQNIYPFIVVGLETGMRRMEILAIRLEHIDFEQKKIHIPKAKAGARDQPITKHLCRVLKPYVERLFEQGHEWLFPAPKSRTGHVVAIEKSFKRVVEEASLNSQQITIHTMRHTAITHLVQAGVDLPTVQRISGHKGIEMVVRYSHQNGEHIQSAMDKLEDRYALA